jgi:hypothetical protein
MNPTHISRYLISTNDIFISFFIWVPTPSAYTQLDHCTPLTPFVALTLFLAFLQGCLVSLVGIQLHTQTQTQTQIHALKSIYTHRLSFFPAVTMKYTD